MVEIEEKTDEEIYIGKIQHLFTTSEVVFVPFVCHRCGKCCRELSVSEFDPFEIAAFLGVSLHEVEKYFRERKAKPCPFLSGNKCTIYPVRPYPCRVYPIGTDFGDCGIGCPGLLEVRRAVKKLDQGIPYCTRSYIAHQPPNKVRVRPERWNKTLEKYLRSKPSKKALELFIKVNKPR